MFATVCKLSGFQPLSNVQSAKQRRQGCNCKCDRGVKRQRKQMEDMKRYACMGRFGEGNLEMDELEYDRKEEGQWGETVALHIRTSAEKQLQGCN